MTDVTVSAQSVKALRDKTGAGMMDSKKALVEAGGDLDLAAKLLREKGVAKVAKREGKATKEGLVYSYIHPGDRLGVLIELNCETDFVARTDDFRKLAKEMAMQIAAANPQVISADELPQEAIDEERDTLRKQALNEGKPEAVVEKIVEGRIKKYQQEACLLLQPFIKDQDRTVGDLLTATASKVGENITISRFVRFRLGDDTPA